MVAWDLSGLGQFGCLHGTLEVFQGFGPGLAPMQASTPSAGKGYADSRQGGFFKTATAMIEKGGGFLELSTCGEACTWQR